MVQNDIREPKAKTCLRCGSDHVVKVVPASALCVPEIRKDVEEGRAVANCCCSGSAGSGIYRCLDCNFEWDRYLEMGILEELEAKK
jgi:hypothetical protein